MQHKGPRHTIVYLRSHLLDRVTANTQDYDNGGSMNESEISKRWAVD